MDSSPNEVKIKFQLCLVVTDNLKNKLESDEFAPFKQLCNLNLGLAVRAGSTPSLPAVLKFPAQFVGSSLRKFSHFIVARPDRAHIVLSAPLKRHKSLISPLISTRISLSFVQCNVISYILVIDSHSLQTRFSFHRNESLQSNTMASRNSLCSVLFLVMG
jgi:hypothetical protein